MLAEPLEEDKALPIVHQVWSHPGGVVRHAQSIQKGFSVSF